MGGSQVLSGLPAAGGVPLHLVHLYARRRVRPPRARGSEQLCLTHCAHRAPTDSFIEFGMSIVVVGFTLLVWMGEDIHHIQAQNEVRERKHEKAQ